MEVDAIKELFTLEVERATGQKVMAHTRDCVLYKLEHENCFGCEHELPCSMLVALMLNLSGTSLGEYPEDKFEQRHIAILTCKSVKSLQAII